jgi:AraC family transcriptional activator of pobA
MPSFINTVVFRTDLLLELELTSIRRILDSKAPSLYMPSRAGFYHVIWVQRGQATHTVDFEPVALGPGSLLFVGPSRVHTFDLTADYDGQMVLFTDAFFARSQADAQFLHTTILFQDLLDIPVVQTDGNAPAVVGIFAQLATELAQEADPYQPVVLQNLLHNLLLLAERARRQQGFRPLDKGPDLDYTVLFRDLLETQFKTQRAVRAYAAQIGVSEKRLAQATAKTLGKLPKELIDERVTLEAKRLLVHTRDSMKEIGFALGFDEPTNFVKYFRRQAGMTPIEFRELHPA